MTEWLAQMANLPMVLLSAALGLVMMLDAIPLLGLLVPADVAILTAVGARGTGDEGVMVASVLIGGLTGASLTFVAGRWFAGRIRTGRVGAWISESRWAAAERMLAQHGGRMVAVAPFLPVFNTLVPLVAGGLRMPYRRFVASVAVGFTLWAGVLVGLGSAAKALGGLLPGGSFTTIATVSIGLLMGWVVMVGLRKRLALADPGTAATSAAADLPIAAELPAPAAAG
jgi:membrane protein DedA with SNARE-associated domain